MNKNRTYSVTVILQRLFLWSIITETALYFLTKDNYLQVSGFYYPLFAAFIIGVIFVAINFKIDNHFQKESLFLILLIVVRTLLSINNFNSGYFFSYLLLASFFFFISSNIIPYKNIKWIYYSYLILVLILSALILVLRIPYYSMDSRLTIQLKTKMDPNYLGACFSLIIIWLTDKLFSTKKIYSKIIIITTTGLILWAQISTGSRGAFLSTVIGDLILLFYKFNNMRKRYVFSMLVLALTVLISYFIVNKIYPNRFNLANWQDHSNVHRIELWQRAWDCIKHRPILGYGLYPTKDIIGSVTGTYSTAHNTYLEIWLHTGFLGILIIFKWFYSFIFKSRSYIVKAFAISTFIFAVFISIEANYIFWLNMSICVLVNNFEGEKNKCKIKLAL